MLITRRSNCINTASGIVFSISDRPVCRLRRDWFLLNQFLLNLHTGRSLTEEIVPSQSVPSQPAHRTVTYRGTGSFSISSFSTCTPDGHLQMNWFLLNLHTGRSLTENTIPNVVLIQSEILMMGTELPETCRGLSLLLHREFRRINLIINQQMHLYTISH